MIGKAILFWVSVLVAFGLLVQFAPGTAKSVDRWMDYSPLFAVALGLAVVFWRRRKRAVSGEATNDSGTGSPDDDH
jgi:membrane protein DedA with SNARE-associated domain